MVLFWIFISTLLVSLIGLVGIIFFFIKDKYLKRLLIFLVSFASGTLFSGALYHLFSESLEHLELKESINFLIIGFLVFFLLENLFFWHHCHKYKCKVHSFTYLIILADILHNFIDGLIISSSYLINFELGIISTFLVIIHEIPQEIGNFSLLVFGGIKKLKALLFCFFSQLSAIVGGMLGFYLLSSFSYFLLPIAAGGFLYISASDLIPILREEKNIRKKFLTFFYFLIGMILLYLI